MNVYDKAIAGCETMASSIDGSGGYIDPDRLAETLRSIAQAILHLKPSEQYDGPTSWPERRFADERDW